MRREPGEEPRLLPEDRGRVRTSGPQVRMLGGSTGTYNQEWPWRLTMKLEPNILIASLGHLKPLRRHIEHTLSQYDIRVRESRTDCLAPAGGLRTCLMISAFQNSSRQNLDLENWNYALPSRTAACGCCLKNKPCDEAALRNVPTSKWQADGFSCFPVNTEQHLAAKEQEDSRGSCRKPNRGCKQ
ncbi:unnamed protein product [Pleuronectes platessa]|uniref:Uncharacterized protein n=1 Tax=Pleuronectes platessa TaxID=8262 RepID=A0A9N7YM55_PLEPL|nr:unnamed protein product [Pleuronectes platessa]